MLGSANIITFIGTSQPEVSKVFYEKMLGLELVADEPHALVFDANGTMLRISKVETLTPMPFSVLGWEVTDIEAVVALLTEVGVTFRLFDGVAQDASGIASFPDGTRVAWFEDPDGNLLSISEYEPNQQG